MFYSQLLLMNMPTKNFHSCPCFLRQAIEHGSTTITYYTEIYISVLPPLTPSNNVSPVLTVLAPITSVWTGRKIIKLAKNFVLIEN